MLSAAPLAPAAVAAAAAAPPAQPGYVIGARLGSTIQPAAQPQSGPKPYDPQQVQTAYGVNLINFNGIVGTGAGQTVAIVDAYNDPNIIDDTKAFDSQFSLQQFNGSGEPTFQVLNQNGGTSLAGIPEGQGWDIEESLDVEWVHSMAPDANIILFEANSSGTPDMFQAETTAAGFAGVSVVSNSWGSPEFQGENTVDSTFTTPANHQGVTFLAGSGDHGSPGLYPAFSPNVIAVGGTSLQINSDSTYNSESVWNDGNNGSGLAATGGGISTLEPQPSYQVGKVNGISSTQRLSADVSALADPNTGVYVYDSFAPNGPWFEVGGTSLATPLWAGMIAIANQGRALLGEGTLNGPTQTLPMLYSLPASDFHDITSGGNGTYNALTGYDIPTGVGTPYANLVVPALAGYTPTGTWTVTSNSTIGGAALDDTMLLPTGQLFTHSRTNLSTWYLYTPDTNGDYINGTATAAGAMKLGVEDFASTVLPNGQVFVVYGKNSQGSGTNTAEMYNPATNSWTVVASDPVAATNGPGNEPSELLNNGDILVGDPTGNGTELYDPTTNTWSTGGATIYNNPTLNEGWVKLPNGDILEYDATSSFLADKFEAELYNPTTNSWSDASTSSNGSTLPLLTAGASMGPAVLLPDGRALFTGVNGVTLFFNTSNDTWTQGPTVPSVLINGTLTQLTETEGPEAVLPDGDVVMELAAPSPSTEVFIYDFNPTAGVWTNITPPSTIVASFNLTVFNTMLILPTGQLLLNATSGAQQLAIYTPNAGPQPAWQPTITSFVPNSNGSYTLTGTQLNGLDEGAAFSDGFYQMAENYPIVQVTDTVTGDVYYATTSNWSSTGVATGSELETVNVVVPAALGNDPFTVVVIANGIASNVANQPPTISAPSTAGVTENGTLTFSSANANAISVTDASANGNADSLTLSVLNGTLALGSTTGLSFTAGTDNSASFTVSGTIANLNAGLSGLTYTPTTGYLGTDSLSLSISDPGNSLSASATVSLTVVAPVTGTWVDMSKLLPQNDAGQLSLLLPDGQLLVHGGGGEGPSASWYLVTPDSSGSYINGTWTVAGSMNVGRLYFASDVLQNDNVFVVGGEYATDNSFSNSAEIYNFATNTWKSVASSPLNSVGDEPSELLPNGNILVGDIEDSGTELYNPTTNTWSPGGTKIRNDQSDEEPWVKLANGDILSYDMWSSANDNKFEAELYNPATNTWADASKTNGTIPILSSGNQGFELGPALLLPDGRALFTGATGLTAFFDPSTDTWTQGPMMPSVMINGVQTQLTMGDAPGAILPNGDVVLALSPAVFIDNTGEEQFPGPTYIYDFNPTADVWTNITPSSTVDPNIGGDNNSFINTMLILPTGQLLLTDDNNQLAIYTPTSGSPQNSWKPVVTSFTKNGNGTYTLTGQQLNGLDEGAAYGDDNQMAENYPIVQVTDTANGHILYATTSNWSSVGVATGTATETVTVTMPTALGNDPFTLEVIADGIASNVFSQAPTFAAPNAVTVNQGSTLSFTGNNTISLSDTLGTAEQATLSVSHGTLSMTGAGVSNSGTSTVTFTGTLANLNAALATLTYTPTNGYNGSDTLSLSDTDAGDSLSGIGSVAITVSPVAPSISVPAPVAVPMNSTLPFAGANVITVTDISGTIEQMTLSVSHGTLTLTTTGLTTANGNGTASVTLGGAITTLNTDLATLVYTPTPGYSGGDTLSLSDKDTTDGLTGAASVAITVEGAPTVSTPTTATVTENGSLTFSSANNNQLTVADLFADGAFDALTLSVSHGILTLGSTSGVNITGGANGSGSVTLTGTIDNLNAALNGLVYQPNANFENSDTLAVSLSNPADGLKGSSSVSISINPLAPTIAGPGVVTVDENASLIFSTGNGNAITINDVNTEGDSVALSVSHGTLTLSTTTGLTFTNGNNGTSSFTVSGTLSNLSTALNGLTYQPTLNYFGADSLAASITNVGNHKASSTGVILNIDAIPTVVAPSSVSLTVNTSFTFSSASNQITVADQSAGSNPDSLTLTVSNGTITLGTTNGLTFTQGSDGSSSFVVSGTLGNLTAGINGLTYQPNINYVGSDSLVASLFNPGDGLSGTSTVALAVNAVTAPTIAAPATATVAENGTLVFTSGNSNAISIADNGTGGNPDSLTMTVTHGTLTLASTSGLIFTAGGNGSASFAVRGTLSNLNAALTSVTYQPTTTFAGSDSLAIMVTDSTDGMFGSASVGLTVSAGAPSITAPRTAAVTENASFVFSGSNLISVADAFPGATDSLKLSVAQGKLTLASTAGLTVTGSNGSASFTVSGTVKSLNADLIGLIYQPTAGYFGPDTLAVSLSDPVDSLSGAANVAITVNPLSAPSIAAPASASVVENTSLVFSSANNNAITVGDSIAGSNSDSLTLSVAHGTLTLATTSGLTFTTGSNGGASFIVTGTVANLNVALNGLTYRPTANYSSSDALALSITDPVDNESASASVALSVTAFSPPSISAPVTGAVILNGSLVFSSANKNAITVADTGPGSSADSLTLSVAQGTVTLATTSGLMITSGANGSASVTVTGSVANLNAALNGLTYKPTTGYTGFDSLAISLMDSAKGDGLSASSSVALTIAASPPAITAPASAAVFINASLTFSSANKNAISIADINAGSTVEPLTLTTTDGTLSLGSTNGITFTNGTNNSASMTINGTLANLNTALSGLTFLPTKIGTGTIVLTYTDLGNGLMGSAVINIAVSKGITKLGAGTPTSPPSGSSSPPSTASPSTASSSPAVAGSSQVSGPSGGGTVAAAATPPTTSSTSDTRSTPPDDEAQWQGVSAAVEVLIG